MHVDGRTVIVTGASSGIGRATAHEFARRRAHVVLASRGRDKLDALAGELVDYPGRRLVVPTDVTDRLAVEALVRRTVEELDGVDVLVNNAGVGLFAPIATGSLDNMHHLFNVNGRWARRWQVRGQVRHVHLTQHVLLERRIGKPRVDRAHADTGAYRYVVPA